MAKELEYYPHLHEVLKEYGEAARNRYRELLTKEGKNASKDLFNSVQFRVKMEGTHYEVGLDLAYYWKFVEGGTKGKKYPNALCRQHFPPLPPIERWITRKPIVPKASANGKLPTLQQLSFLIARSIAKNGIKPAPILAQTSKEMQEQFSAKIQEAFLKDVAGFVPFIMEGFKGV